MENHVNPLKVKEKAMSDEGKAYSKELEDLNWKLQEVVFNHAWLQAQYDLKALKYKKFLGYDVDSQQIEKLEKEVDEFERIGVFA